MRHTSNYILRQETETLARELRKKSTLSEIVLRTNLLKALKLKGYQFLRQRPIDKYIADFFCKELKLIIELDGVTHIEKQKVDKTRQRRLEELGFHVLRFEDIDVIGDLEGVKLKLEDWINVYEEKHPEVLKIKERRKNKNTSP